MGSKRYPWIEKFYSKLGSTMYLLFIMFISSCSLFFDIPAITDPRYVLKSDLNLAPSSSILTSSCGIRENLLDNLAPFLSYKYPFPHVSVLCDIKHTWDDRKWAKTTQAVSGMFFPWTKAWWNESSCLAWAAESGLNTKMTPWASLWMADQQPSNWLDPLASHSSTSAFTFLLATFKLGISNSRILAPTVGL